MTTPNPEAKLYGFRYLFSYLEQARWAGIKDDAAVDELQFLLELARFEGGRKSQLGQDFFALSMNGMKRGGYFVEVGAHHGEQLSNTWLLEKEYGWNGLLVEPNPAHQQNLRMRSAELVEYAAWKRTGDKLTFHATADSALSSLAGIQQSDAHDRSDFKALVVETMTLNDILTARGAPKVIDFMSIDVEGAEIDVIDGLNLDNFEVNAMCLEHNHDKKRLAEIGERLRAAGMRNVFENVSDFDTYYVRPAAYDAWRATSR